MKTRKSNKFMALLLTLTMLMTMISGLTITVSAATNPVVLTKELIITDEGMPNELKLEAYVTGSLETSSGSIPADIILVLDQSGSMDDNITSDGVTKSKLQIMEEAVTSFTQKVAELN
ncbi:MAG: hypothetical protein E7417_05465 [Ruminococcaceae bacterium]|nr:hypothetical protein [Oscillospiraceae bacterium]